MYTIYRLEDFNGNGPFHGTIPFFFNKNYNKHHDKFNSKYDRNLLPVYKDPLLEHKFKRKIHLFAFENKQQFLELNKELFDVIKILNLQIIELKVSNIIVGTGQVMFKRENIIESNNITELVLNEW